MQKDFASFAWVEDEDLVPGKCSGFTVYRAQGLEFQLHSVVYRLDSRNSGNASEVGPWFVGEAQVASSRHSERLHPKLPKSQTLNPKLPKSQRSHKPWSPIQVRSGDMRLISSPVRSHAALQRIHKASTTCNRPDTHQNRSRRTFSETYGFRSH